MVLALKTSTHTFVICYSAEETKSDYMYKKPNDYIYIYI